MTNPLPAPLILVPASPQNPDLFIVDSKDMNAAAGQAIVKSPLLPVGSQVMLQIVSSRIGQTFHLWYTIQSADTPLTVASAFADLINNNAALAAGEVGGQYVVATPLCAISHRFDDVIELGACAFYPDGSQVWQDNGGTFILVQPRQQLDAGPAIGLSRTPTGWSPTAGSNVGQVQFGGPTTATTGRVAGQYATICGNILDANAATIRGEFEIDTAESIDGVFTIQKRVGVSKGLYMSGADGNSLGDMGKGTINAVTYYMNNRQIGVRADGTLYLI